jgi:hypothetical protein
MWKANGKTTTLQLFLDSLSPKLWKRLWTCRKTDQYLNLNIESTVMQCVFLIALICLLCNNGQALHVKAKWLSSAPCPGEPSLDTFSSHTPSKASYKNATCGTYTISYSVGNGCPVPGGKSFFGEFCLVG